MNGVVGGYETKNWVRVKPYHLGGFVFEVLFIGVADGKAPRKGSLDEAALRAVYTGGLTGPVLAWDKDMF